MHMAIRLRDLHPWVNSWSVPELFAGTCTPSGAEDAWYETALILELAKLQDNPLTGGGTDIFKCFDQIPFDLLLDLLIAGGCPGKIVKAYGNFHRDLIYHNSVAGSLGKPHRHFCGIPQGCPLSMTWIAFLLVPWVHAVRQVNAFLVRSLTMSLSLLVACTTKLISEQGTNLPSITCTPLASR